MKRFTKISIVIVSTAAIVFAIYNFFWFSWSFVCFGEYSQPMEVQRKGTHVEYRESDMDDFVYMLEMPEYLTYRTGRMRVSRMNIPTRDALEITPQPFARSVCYTALLQENGRQYIVEVDETGSPMDAKPDEAALAERRRGEICALIDKARLRWRL